MVVQHTTKALEWPTAQRRWRAEELIWRTHRDRKRLDTVGKGNSSWLWYMEHEQLSSVVEFELTTNVHGL